MRSRARLGLLGGIIALAVLPATAAAYNQLTVPPPDDGTKSCETEPTPCIRWSKTASNLSINVDVYLHSSLSSQEINLKDIALDSMGKYNAIAARNPHLQTTTSTANDEIYVSAVSLGNPFAYGLTTSFYDPDTKRITYSTIKLNTQIQWNTIYEYDCWSIPVSPNTQCEADAYKVMSHEFGHAEGLAHETINTVAIMVQGEPATQYHAVKQDDKDGIIHIYGAYP